MPIDRRHFRRKEDLESDDRPLVWQDIRDDDGDSTYSVWVLDDPLGMGNFAVRAGQVAGVDDLEDAQDTDHVDTTESLEAAREAAIAWMAERA